MKADPKVRAVIEAARAVVRHPVEPRVGGRLVLEADLLRLEAALAALETETV